MVRNTLTIQKIVHSLQNSLWKMQKGMCGMSKIYEALNYSFANEMILNLENILKFFHRHTYWLSPPSLLGFYCWDTHLMFPETCYYFLEKA